MQNRTLAAIQIIGAKTHLNNKTEFNSMYPERERERVTVLQYRVCFSDKWTLTNSQIVFRQCYRNAEDWSLKLVLDLIDYMELKRGHKIVQTC